MAKLTRNGQTFETQNNHYGYYDGMPCKIVDLHGDFDAWKATDTVVLQAETLGGGWVRYWLSSSDPAKRASLAEIASA